MTNWLIREGEGATLITIFQGTKEEAERELDRLKSEHPEVSFRVEYVEKEE